MRALLFVLGVTFSLVSCGKYNKKQDTVIVIGAGVAGLAAANELRDNGVANVIVLEAQDRVGGRVTTNYSLNVPFDEGASWIHGPDGNNPITMIAAEAGAQTFVTDDDNAIIYDMDGTPYADGYYDTQDAAFEDAIRAIDNNGARDQSFETVYNSLYGAKIDDRFWKFMLSSYIEFDTGGDVSNLSSRYFYDDDEYPGTDVIITNGYDKVPKHLAKGLDVRFNQKVTKIDYRKKNKVIVTASGQEWECSAVICTVPLGVLKKEIIEFIPALPQAHLEAISYLDMGAVNKYLLLWDTAFWDVDKQYIGITPETKGKFNYFLNLSKFSDENALMTFTFGDYSKTVEAMTDAEVRAEIMDHLRTMYGTSIPDPTAMVRTKWISNEYSFGSYSYVLTNGTSKAYEILAEPLGNQIYFAGEHTSFDYRGTVHGAYESGVTASKLLLRRFRK